MASLLLKKRTRDYDDDDDDDNNNTINSTTPSQRSFNIGPTVYNKRKTSHNNNVIHNANNRVTSTFKRSYSAALESDLENLVQKPISTTTTTKTTTTTTTTAIPNIIHHHNNDNNNHDSTTNNNMVMSQSPISNSNNKRRRSMKNNIVHNAALNAGVSPNNSFLRSLHIENAIRRGRGDSIPLASPAYSKTWLLQQGNNNKHHSNSNSDNDKGSSDDGSIINTSNAYNDVIFSFSMKKDNNSVQADVKGDGNIVIGKGD